MCVSLSLSLFIFICFVLFGGGAARPLLASVNGPTQKPLTYFCERFLRAFLCAAAWKEHGFQDIRGALSDFRLRSRSSGVRSTLKRSTSSASLGSVRLIRIAHASSSRVLGETDIGLIDLKLRSSILITTFGWPGGSSKTLSDTDAWIFGLSDFEF